MIIVKSTLPCQRFLYGQIDSSAYGYFCLVLNPQLCKFLHAN